MTTKPMKSTDEFETFLATFVEELITMPDEDVLEGSNPDDVRAHGLRLFEQAKKAVGRQRMATAKAQLQARRAQPAAEAVEKVDIALARQTLAQAQNDPRFTLAARKLGELSDDEVLSLYRQIKSLQEGDDK